MYAIPSRNTTINKSKLYVSYFPNVFSPLTRCDEDVPEGEAAAVVRDDLADAQRQSVPAQVDGQGEGGGRVGRLAGDDSLRRVEGGGGGDVMDCKIVIALIGVGRGGKQLKARREATASAGSIQTLKNSESILFGISIHMTYTLQATITIQCVSNVERKVLVESGSYRDPRSAR